MNTTHQAVEAAERIRKIVDNYILAVLQDPLAQCGVARKEFESALSDALTLPQDVAAEVGPEGLDTVVSMLMRTIDAYAFDYAKEGKLAPMRQTVAGELKFTLLAASRSPAPAGVAGGVDASLGAAIEQLDALDDKLFDLTQRQVDAHDIADVLGGLREVADKVKEALAATQAQPSPHPAVGGSGGGLTSEQDYCIKEGARIAACDEYFKARPQIDTLDRRKVFESGFDRGYDAKGSK